MADQPENERSEQGRFSTTEVNIYDENHSAIGINSFCSLYRSDVMFEFRPLDTSSTSVKYINDKANIKFTINVNETPLLIRKLEKFISGELPEFVIEHHHNNVKRNLVFTQGSAFYDDSGDNPEMAEKCQDSRAIYVEDVSSDDENDHKLTVFIDYGQTIEEIENSEVVFSELEIFKSAIEQLYNSFMRFDFTSTRILMASSRSGGGGGSAAAKPQPRPKRPTRRGVGKQAPPQSTTTESSDAESDEVADINSMFNGDGDDVPQ